ncbi:MAG TPA: hypothetical protein P5121_07685 [Caldilineaceae bacterium]|nr:hypothetical protein [Caldilineaceae bacterium]
MQQEVHRRPVAGMALMRTANRLYGLLLYLYPRRFRHEYGEPMAQLFRDAMRERLRRGGMAALFSLWILTLFDLVRSVFVEQMAELFHVSVDWGGTTMTYLEKIREFAREPEQLELAYQAAVKAGERGAFTEAIQLAHTEDSGNLLYSAWYYRLLHAAGRVIAWSWAVPLAILNGLLLWWLSDEQGYTLQIVNPFSGVQGHSSTPLVLVVGMGIAAIIIITFLAGAGDRHWRRLVLIALGLMGVTAYVIYFFPQTGTSLYQEQYLALMPLNLALLAWAGIGIYALIGHWDPGNRFAFLVKSLEFLIVGGLFGFILLLFTGVTVGLFSALGIEPPEEIMRLFFAGGAGMIGVLAVALAIEPGVAPRQQPFDEGLSRLIPLLLRLLLPLAVLVLTIFVFFIPANFWQPFNNREVLIAFNALLFAVIALLVGVVPLAQGDLSERLWHWLWRGILALTVLTLIVGIYALAAILYRTLLDRLTPNRLTFIGWNVINIGVLFWLLVLQWRAKGPARVHALQRTLAGAMIPYAMWALLTLLALPWLFPINQGEVAALPKDIQHVVGEQPYPILLKCASSPHIYALDRGEKHWIKDIQTFEAQGFEWRDVHFTRCETIDAIPDGPPIPADAGVPPDAQ